MNKTDWWMLGTVKIPKSKKDEFNSLVMEILDKGGIRKIEQIPLGNSRITVVKKPLPNEEGVISFDYSIFEKKVREVCTYDTNTCQLSLADHGGNEFGMVMNFIMILQESYSEGNCFMMHKDSISCGVEYVLSIMLSMTGRKFYLDHRFNFLDMILFLRKNKIKMKLSELIHNAPWDYTHYINYAQINAAAFIVLGEISEPNEETKIHNKTEIQESNAHTRYYFVYEIMQHLYKEDKDNLEKFVYKLITLNIKERTKIAGQNDDYGNIASASLHMFPAEILKIYSLVSKVEIWELWDVLDGKPYKCVLNNNLKEIDVEAKPIPFYRSIRRKNEDEFLEFWTGDNLVLSEKMKSRIGEWEHFMDDMDDILADDVERELLCIINELYEDWGCRYLDEDFVKLMLNNKENPYYRKVLVMLKKMMHEDYKYFPELTESQAKNWVVKRCRDPHDKVAMIALQSLIINENQRKQILGF